MLGKVEKRKPDIDHLEGKAETVIDNNCDTAEVRSAVNRVSEPISGSVETCTLRLKKKRENLRRVFIKHASVDDVLENFSEQLKAIEKKEEQQRPVSAVFEIVQNQRDNSEAVLADVNNLNAGYKDLERKVHEVVDREAQPKEKDRVIESFEKIRARFEKVKEDVTRTVRKTKEVEEPARIHTDKATRFARWLENVEKTFKDVSRKGTDGKCAKDAAKKRKDTLKASITHFFTCSFCLLLSWHPQ